MKNTAVHGLCASHPLNLPTQLSWAARVEATLLADMGPLIWVGHTCAEQLLRGTKHTMGIPGMHCVHTRRWHSSALGRLGCPSLHPWQVVT